MTVQDFAKVGPAMELSQLDYQTIFEAVSDAVLIFDVQSGKILDVNQRMCEMFACSREEARKLEIQGLCIGEAGCASGEIPRLAAKTAAGSLQSFECQVKDRAGRIFWVNVHLKYLTLNGRACILAELHDIDQRKYAEEALKESEARYRMVTEESLAGVYIIQEGGFVYVNPTMAQTFGYRPEEILDRSVEPKDLVHPDDIPLVREKIHRRLSGELAAAHYTFRGLHKDGSVIYGESFGRAVEYQGCPAIVGTFLDITEKRLAEEALKASEAKYRKIFSAINDAIMIVDPETGDILEVNQKFLELSGYQAAEANHLTLANLCSADSPFSLSEVHEWMRKAVEEGPQLFEWCAEDRSGRRFWVETSLTLTPLGDRDLLLAVSRDIAERKQLENIRLRAYEELEFLVAERTAGLQSANVQLKREIVERRHTEAIIRLQRDLSLTLSGKVGLQAALRLCVQTAITISGLDSGGAYLVDPDSGDLALTYHQGLSAEFVQNVSQYQADSINAYMVLAGSPMYARLKDLPGILDDKGLKEGLRSAAIIPVIHQGRVIASLNIASHKYEEVPETARAFLETLAVQMGSTIARVQAEEALRRAKEELEVRVAERTAQLIKTNKALQEELQTRRQIEQSLRLSETKYRTLVEQIPAITYIISVLEKIDFLYVSPQVETLLGFSPEEWRADAENWKRQVHPDDLERVLAEIAHSYASGEPLATEYRIMSKSGRIVWFRDEARVVYGQAGQFLFLQGLALDITERKHAEEALRETTQTLQTLIHAAPLAIISIDRDFKIRLWNPGAERMFGWQESEMLGQTLPHIPKNQRAETIAMLQREMSGEKQTALELRRSRKDGAPIDVQLWTAPLKNGRGEVVGNMGIFADITASKRAQEALQEANFRLRTLIQASPLAIIALNQKGKVISWNPAAERIFGWRQEEVMGRLLPTIPKGQKQDFQELHRGKLQGLTLGSQEARRQRRDGALIDVNLSTAPLEDGAGNIIGTMGIVEDITARKQMEETLRKVSRALKAITECHQALIRATNEPELLKAVCRIIVDVGGYRMAWVGFAEHDVRKTVRPMAQTGFDDGYVEQLNLSWADKGRGRGPVGNAIRLGKPVLCPNIQRDRKVAFVHEEARKRGYASILALPLTDDVTTFGALGIYAATPDAFNEEEIKLLSGLANDLAFGIAALRARTERQRTDEALKASEQELRMLTSQLLSIQEQERRRVARELHDELGQALTVLKIHLVAIEEKLAADQQHLKASCEQMLSYIDTVIENVRRLAWDLSPSSLEDLGLSSSLGYLVDEVSRNNNMKSSVVMDEIDHLFASETQINIYRIFQESLTNIVKHAEANEISVNVERKNGEVSFMIRDDGRGFDLNHAMSGKFAKKNLGLTAMHERALMAQGSFQISTQEGRGTTITFSIPINKSGK